MFISFTMEGINYTVKSRAYEAEKIVLPDGRLLKVVGWAETFPPCPKKLIEIPCDSFGLTPYQIALKEKAVLAIEVEKC